MIKWLLVFIIGLLVQDNNKVESTQCSIANNQRLDCFPENGASSDQCQARGCCWQPPTKDNFNRNFIKKKSIVHSTNVPIDIPYCYYPEDYPNYQISNVIKTDKGVSATLQKSSRSYLPNDILKLQLQISFDTKDRLRIKLIDPSRSRYEVPIELSPPDSNPPANSNYEVIIPNQGDFQLEIKRKSDGVSLFKSIGPLLYSDQFIQVAFQLTARKGYGIGEQNRDLMYDLTQGWTRMGFWARDNPIGNDINLYGIHPFFLALMDNGKGYGAYFHNSNALEFNTQPDQILTYRTIGGILDFFVFTGDSLVDTVKQYHNLIGKPMLPSFWNLGFHLSRYGYKNVADMSATLTRNLKANIPIEVQWADIDYMNKYKDFTFDPNNFKDLGSYVDNNHKLGLKNIIILDPGISIQSPGIYPAYDDILSMGCYIRQSQTNKPLIGKVWPGNTVYPDFTHPNATSYWKKQIARFLQQVNVDGLWIDMNEPSNFYDGSINGCPNSNLNTPFFIPNIRDGSLIKKTVCPSALQYNNVPHYNLHNLYGYSESKSTYTALGEIYNNLTRPFVLTRSSYSGSGRYTFHWTGDNSATWDQYRNSIRQILNFNMYGISMVGADICGFLGETTEELCTRWTQLGSFYPFMRNHNDKDSKNQDPASWSLDAQNSMKKAIYTRYMLLPYMYTLFVKSYLNGGMVAQPLSFEFPTDNNTHDIQFQFMLGPAILVNPVTEQGATSVSAYFPAGVWYDIDYIDKVYDSNIGGFMQLDAPLNKINVALRGGYVVPIMQLRMTTSDMHENSPLGLVGILSKSGYAQGELYWDDGQNLQSYVRNNFTYITFTADNNSFTVTPVTTTYQKTPVINYITMAGINLSTIKTVTINGASFKFSYENNILNILSINVSPLQDIKVLWN